MVAGEKADAWRARIAREGQRERHLERRPVRAPSLPLEIEGIEIADPGRAKGVRVRRCVAAFKHQHRKPLASRQRIAVECAERKEPRPVRLDLCGLGHGEQLDEAIRNLYDVVLGAPRRRVTVARADLEAERAVERDRGIEIVHRVDDVIDAARHR